MRRSAAAAGLALATLAVGCGEDPPLTRSCAGEAVRACPPHAYAVVTEGTLTPPEIEIGDPDAEARIHVRLQTCGAAAPGVHSVRVRALATRGGRPDGGASTMLFSLVTVRDDDGDGTIDATVPNPFGAEVPAASELELLFVPFLDGCEGEALEDVPYRTGPIWEPPP